LDERADVLRYDGEAAAAPLDIVGPVEAVVFVETDAPSFDVVVKLVDVSPDGVALPITDGIHRVARAGDGPQRVEVSLADTAWRVQPGHRLRVQVQSANYPHFDANPGTGAPLGSSRTGRPATIAIGHSAATPSAIELRVLPSPESR
jgi:putative CocE/NonD family hydrolase